MLCAKGNASTPDKLANSGYTQRMTETPDDEFATQQKLARRLNIWVNVIIFLSSGAGALFIIFVVSQIFPSGRKTPDDVNVPAATLSSSIIAFHGQNDSGLYIDIRDLDATEGYADTYGRQLQKDIGINKPGRIYRLNISNVGEQSLDLSNLVIQLGGHELKPLAEYSSNPTLLGRLHVQQSKFRRQLTAGSTIQCLVFAADMKASISEIESAAFEDRSGKFELEKSR